MYEEVTHTLRWLCAFSSSRGTWEQGSMVQRPAGLMLGMKYAETPFTDLNYSIPEHVRAGDDLMVAAQGGFKTSVTYVINKRAKVK